MVRSSVQELQYARMTPGLRGVPSSWLLLVGHLVGACLPPLEDEVSLIDAGALDAASPAARDVNAPALDAPMPDDVDAPDAAARAVTAPVTSARPTFRPPSTGLAADCPIGSYDVHPWSVPLFRIAANVRILPSQACAIGKARLAMESSGTLVIFDELGQAQKSYGSSAHGAYAMLHEEGVLALHDAGDQVVWSADVTPLAPGEVATLAVQADGNVVIYARPEIPPFTWRPTWAANTQH
jgi:hypothetical protein